MRAAALVLAAFVALLASISCAYAHAFLDHARPTVGSTVRGSPTEVNLWFTQALEPAFSTVRVLDKSGRQVDMVNKAVDREDKTLLRVSVPQLPPGSYRVIWHVLSVDAHVTEGDFTFEVTP